MLLILCNGELVLACENWVFVVYVLRFILKREIHKASRLFILSL